MREFSGGYARTTVHQNLLLRWVRDEAVHDVYARLGELGLNTAGADEIADVVSCPGTDSFEELVSELKLPVEFNADNLAHFIDWSRSEPYRVERGEGECAV